MKLNNLIEELNTKEKFIVSKTKIISGNDMGSDRIILMRESGPSIVLANSIHDYQSYKKFIGRTVEAEVYETKLSPAITEEGVLKQMIGYLEDNDVTIEE